MIINPYIFLSTNPLWNGLQAYYTADNTPNDALGTYDGTLTNGATYDTGIINQGFSLDGVNDYITTGVRNGFVNSDNFTFSAWINTNDSSSNKLYVTNFASTSSGPSLAIWNSKPTLFRGNNALLSGVTVLPSNTWFHLTISHTPYDGATPNVTFYVNGVFDSSGIFSVGTTVGATTQFIGGFSTTTISVPDCIIDEIGIWERALTASEVTELYNGGAGKQYPTGIDVVWNDLLAYYTADNTPNDATSNGYNGTLTNGATYGTGIINQGFSLDGVNDYVDIGNVLDFNGNTEFTFNIWINADNSSPNNVFLSKYDGAKGYLFRKSSSGTNVNLAVIHSSTKYLSVNSVGGNIVTGVDTMLTVTYDGLSISGIKFYQDGNLLTNSNIFNSFTFGTHSSSNSANFNIGSLSGSSSFFGGIEDEVGIWSRALTSSEVTELYNSGAGKQY